MVKRARMRWLGCYHCAYANEIAPATGVGRANCSMPQWTHYYHAMSVNPIALLTMPLTACRIALIAA
jgi:hypothetical protein